MRIALFLLFFALYGANGSAQQGVVADLKIQGNQKVKTSFIKKLAIIESGKPLDSALIEEDIKRLKRLPSVSHAYYQVFYYQDNSYNVFYNIVENFTFIPSINIYTTNDDEFAYRLGLYEFNLFGQNIGLGGFYQKDIYSSYAINFRAPNLFSRQFGLAVNYQDLTTLEPVFLESATANYKYNNESFEILGLYELNFNNRIELGVNYFTEDYSYQSGAIDPAVPQKLNIHKLLFKGIYDYNNLDYFYQYVTGFRSLLNLQYVISTSKEQLDFVIGWNNFYYFERIGSKGNWANRLRVGLSSNQDTPFAPFSVDNNINIRGVGNTIDRGTGTLILNTEYRHTLYEKNSFVVQGNAFIDSGSWRLPGGKLNDFIDSDNIKVYSGLGLRFIHKKVYNAIFRIDYGIRLNKNGTRGFVFGIGQYF